MLRQSVQYWLTVSLKLILQAAYHACLPPTEANALQQPILTETLCCWRQPFSIKLLTIQMLFGAASINCKS